MIYEVEFICSYTTVYVLAIHQILGYYADSFYANFTNMTFQKIPIPHLTRTMKQKFLH